MQYLDKENFFGYKLGTTSQYPAPIQAVYSCIKQSRFEHFLSYSADQNSDE